MKKQSAVLIKDLIPLFLKNMGLEDGLFNSKIYSAWDLVVGESLANQTVTKFYRDKKLYCRISSSVARNHLFMIKKDIKRKMNALLDSDIIQEIILQ